MDPKVYAAAVTLLSLRDRAAADAAKAEPHSLSWAMMDGYRIGLESGLAGIAAIAGYPRREALETELRAEQARFETIRRHEIELADAADADRKAAGK